LFRRHFGVGSEQAGDRLAVRAAALDRLLKNGRVRGHAAHTVLCYEARQPASGQEVALDEIQPHRLPLFLPKSFQSVHSVSVSDPDPDPDPDPDKYLPQS
jgi:hypothetical protein